ncbi:MAG: hypothetical protein Q4B01_07730 [Eubacteriales bacterium]|nr:hypothetical protein [Eubacteriales bacterium]
MSYFLLGNQQSVFAIDLAPWMSASIIVQMMTLAAGRHGARSSAITMQRQIRGLALLFASVSAGLRAVMLVEEPVMFQDLFLERLLVGIVLVAGTCLVLWLSEQNKSKGLGGMILFIFINILFQAVRILQVSVKTIIFETADRMRFLGIYALILLIAAVGMILMYVLEHREHRFPVQRVMIDSSMEQSNYLAIKANPAGAQALMYVMAFYMVLYYLLMLLHMVFSQSTVFGYLVAHLSLDQPVGILTYLLLYMFVSVGLASVQINPVDISEQMQRRGDCIKGIRPGKETEKLIRRTVLSSAVSSALIMSCVLGSALALRIFFPMLQDEVMLPLYLIIMTGISQMLAAEIKAVYTLDHYEQLLDLN